MSLGTPQESAAPPPPAPPQGFKCIRHTALQVRVLAPYGKGSFPPGQLQQNISYLGDQAGLGSHGELHIPSLIAVTVHSPVA